MTKLLLIGIFVLSSCAYGTKVAYNRTNQLSYGFQARYVGEARQPAQEIDAAIWATIYELVARGVSYDKIMSLIKEYSNSYPIYIIDKEFRCESGANGKCMGEFLAGSPIIYNGSIMFVENKCIGLSPISHELIHLFDHLLYDRRDTMHQNSEFFEVGCLWKYKRGSEQLRQCISRTVERTVNTKLCDSWCGGCTTQQLDWQFSEPP